MPILLENTYNQHISRHDVDFQLRMHEIGVPQPSCGERATPCLVILTRSDDMEVSELSLELARRGVRLLRVNRDDPAGRSVTAISTDGTIDSHGEMLRPALAWRRHFKNPANPDSDNLLLEKYVHDQLAALPATLAEVAGKTINGESTITSRLAQLRIAKQSGLVVPPSTMTHDLATAARQLGGNGESDLIIKPIGSHWTEMSHDTMVGNFPAKISSSDALDRPPEPVPVLVQHYVPHDHEIRVFIVGRNLVAYAIREKRSAQSLWATPDSVQTERIELSELVTNQILDFAKRNHVDLGAIEFMVKADGGLVFLEVNLLFDWRFFQAKAGDTGVTDLLVDYLDQEVRP